MKTALGKFAFTASIGLAMAFVFGCSDGSDDGGKASIPDYKNCSGKEYEPQTHFCFESAVYEKCGGIAYSPNSNKCEGSRLLNLCGAEWHEPDISKYCFNGSLKEKETFTDSRNGTVYKSVSIGAQTWMAENLNADLPYFSKCYDDDPENCEKYGRLYNWTVAGSICPPGWHLPEAEEWLALIDYAEGGEEGSGARKLKAASGWEQNNRGTDEFGFSALPGGMCFSRNGRESFDDIGSGAFYWSNTQKDYGIAHAVDMRFNSIYKENGNLGGDFTSDYLSIRCIKD